MSANPTHTAPALHLFADVAIPATVAGLFTYAVPEEFRAVICRGCRVAVPFGNRNLIGIVVGLRDSTPPTVKECKPLIDLIDNEPLISPALLELARWIAEYYCAPLADVLKTLLFIGSTKPARRVVRLLAPANPLLQHAAPEGTAKAKILAALKAAGGKGLTISALQSKLGVKSVHSALNDMRTAGWVEMTEEESSPNIKRRFEEVIAVDALSRRLWLEWKKENESKKRTQKQIALLDYLMACPDGSFSVKQVLKITGTTLSAVRSLQKKGSLTTTQAEVTTAGKEFAAVAPNPNLILNPPQAIAVQTLCAAVDSGKFTPFLLHGVTGSGKTQVYIETIRHALRDGKTAIVLVPEISLTSQIVQRFRGHFGDAVAAMHSRMTDMERRETWRLAHEGKCRIVIGPRSAVFAPLKNIGIVIVDEEHESAFKQFDKMPRYHGRDVAIVRAKCEGAVVVLGSATPSFESYSNAKAGKYTLLELPDRIDDARMPVIEIVDMVVERKQKYALFKDKQKLERIESGAPYQKDWKPPKKFESGSLSDRLKELITDRLAKREGIILLQNRRGFSPILECPDCGQVETCEQCNISLTYHATLKHLRCHYCGFTKQPPDGCTNCGSVDLDYKGFGTQRVEEELLREFPGVRMIRMDLDTTSGRGSHAAMLKKFASGDADILLGTQMVAKGLDFARVTLVGVISADTQMLLPDFRSGERTFQLLTQVAGRAGRSVAPGEVVIQTKQAQHPSLKFVLRHDYKAFYDEEMVFREELSYPPYSRIALVEFNGEIEPKVRRAADAFAELLRKQKVAEVIILGPAPAALAKLRNMHRWQVILKDRKSGDPSGLKLRRLLQTALDAFQSSPLRAGIRTIIDIDPTGMM